MFTDLVILRFFRLGAWEFMIERQGEFFKPASWPARGTLRDHRGDLLAWLGPFHFAACKVTQ